MQLALHGWELRKDVLNLVDLLDVSLGDGDILYSSCMVRWYDSVAKFP